MRSRDTVVAAIGNEDVTGLCQELVRIPSEDPPGDNRAICAYLREYLADRDVDSNVFAPDPLRPNLVATIRLPSPGPNMVLNGHMETLPVGDESRWTEDPFGGRVRAGRLYGRGTKCMKAGIAALVESAVAVRDHGEEARGTITLAFVSDEVNGGRLGTGWLMQNTPGVRGDVALIGEGSSGIGFGNKGVAFLRLVAQGDGGHGAYGFGSASAVHRMLDVLEDLRALEAIAATPAADLATQIEASRGFTDSEHGMGATDALTQVSVNVGVVSGGDKVNVVAGSCTAEVDVRIPPGLTVDDVMDRVATIVGAREGVAVEVRWESEPAATPPDHPWLELLQSNSTELFGKPIPLRFHHGFTDARFFREHGIPAAAVGVRGLNVGAPDECVEVESLLGTTRLFALSIYDFLASHYAAVEHAPLRSAMEG